MKRNAKKELVMTQKDYEDFKNTTKCWICDEDYPEGDVLERYHFHIKT